MTIKNELIDPERNKAVTKNKLSAVVFDCDGVLIESNAAKTHAFGQIVREFGPEAMERLMDYHKTHGGISRFKKFEWFYREVAGLTLSETMMETLCNRFASLCQDAVLKAPMVAGAKESLELLAGRLPMFVASGTPEKELRELLSQRALAPYFKEIRGTPPEKETLLEQIISANGLYPSRVLMVGDATTDFKAARYNGTLFFGRGSRFSEENVPWDEDLTGLVTFLSRHLNAQ